MPPKHRGWNRQNMIKDLRERTGFKKNVVEKVLDTFIDLMRSEERRVGKEC